MVKVRERELRQYNHEETLCINLIKKGVSIQAACEKVFGKNMKAIRKFMKNPLTAFWLKELMVKEQLESAGLDTNWIADQFKIIIANEKEHPAVRQQVIQMVWDTLNENEKNKTRTPLLMQQITQTQVKSLMPPDLL